MSLTEDFLTPKEEQAIVKAIRQAENLTSGEIRVHLEAHTDLQPLERAKEVFVQLNMQKTEARNGVLFYIGVVDHSFVVLGDEGINRVVDADFWESIKDLVITYFKQKQYQEGLVAGILNAGEQLKTHFPISKNDIDELPNEISKS
ncbi:MAG TPA: TPM domain-containing protein [Flavobacterium sp.]|nr:TPM domain-containing protein [Flavobacterium sp.]